MRGHRQSKATPDLVGFLRARLDEDAERWRHFAAVGGQGPWDFLLADIDVKRRIINAAVVAWNNSCDPSDETWVLLAPSLKAVVKLLALPYAGHVDYREEWRP